MLSPSFPTGSIGKALWIQNLRWALKFAYNFHLVRGVENGTSEKGNDLNRKKQKVGKVECGCENKPSMGFKCTDFDLEKILIETQVELFSSHIKWEE